MTFVRRLHALLVGLSLIVLSGHAHAYQEAESEWILVPFAWFVGGLPGLIPYLARLSKTPGYATLGLDLGAGKRFGAGATSWDFSGYPDRNSRLGFMSRSHFDWRPRSPLKLEYRCDAFALLSMAGDPGGPWHIEGIGGLTVAPRFESIVYAAVGPTAGVRLRSSTKRPAVSTEVELLYTPLFGKPASGRRDHTSVTTAISYSPWLSEKRETDEGEALAFELRGRFEWAWGVGPEVGRPDVSLLGGVRLFLWPGDRNRRAPRAAGAR